ncbi:MAG: hypothetical protein JW944_05575 [Deltaproteobacteria bacterium]|nr:hypothetical protein [Deltaproteobacteria bacterium]
MKTIRQSVKIFIILLMTLSCGGRLAVVPEKYNLDNQLENVHNMPSLSIMEWDIVDNQSFILQTGPRDYFLIILGSKSLSLSCADSIRISNGVNFISPGYNNVIINDDGWEDTCQINKIYRLKDYGEAEMIRAQLGR